MSRSHLLPLFVLSLTGLVVALPGSARTADEKQKEGVEVRFDSADGVELHGVFHPARLGKQSPCALLLHDLNSHSNTTAWERLAEGLQADGFAVLRFDFRGHGQSIAIDEAFWQFPMNRGLVRGFNVNSPAESISATDFGRGYHPTLANDIAAAHQFLIRKNDARECNASSVVVIGAGEGATLGPFWIAAEWHRHEATGGPAPRLDGSPAGDDLSCAIWLSPSATLAGRRLPILDWLENAGKENRLPTAFLHGELDREGTTFAERAVTRIRGREAGRELTASRAIARTARRGEALLSSNFDTVPLIRNYVRHILKERGEAEWLRRDFNEQTFFWAFPGAAPILAKVERAQALRPLPLSALGIR